jgi:hypothetical protein
MTKNANAINYFSPAKWVVSTVAGEGTHTSLAGALAAASSGDTIVMMPGTYTENNTITIACNITAHTGDSSGQVIINGSITVSSAITVNLSNLELETNSTYCLIVSGSAASILYCNSCNFNCTNNTGIDYTSSSASSAIYLLNCTGNITTTGIALYTMSSAGALTIYYSVIANNGNTITASSNSAGVVYTNDSIFYFPFSTSSTGTIELQNTIIQNNGNNAVCVTTAGSSTGNLIVKCELSSGTGSAISIGTGTTIIVDETRVSSSNTDPITGAGTIEYGLITYSGSSSTNNVTTQTSLTSQLGSLSLNTALTVANGGTGAATLTSHGVLLGEGTSAISATAAGSSGQVLQSGGASADPAYSTSTYPSTNAVSTLLYASSANVMGALATANNGVLITNGSGVPSINTLTSSYSPTCVGGTTPGTTSYTVQESRYIQIGPIVVLQFNVTGSFGSGAVGTLVVSLPINAVTQTNNIQQGSGVCVVNSVGNTGTWQTSSGLSFMTFVGNTGTQVSVSASNTFVCHGTITYFVD